jgi:predicted transcriptional regulator
VPRSIASGIIYRLGGPASPRTRTDRDGRREGAARSLTSGFVRTILLVDMRKPSPTLTPQELELMKLVWARGSASVRDVYEALLAERRVAYTTVMTMMNVLEKKGHLRKKAVGRSFVYRPTRPQRQVIGSMVREFVERVFGGSAEPLLVHLVEERLTPEELEALARRIEERR